MDCRLVVMKQVHFLVAWVNLAAVTSILAEDRDHSVSTIPQSRILSASQRIDQLIEAEYAKNKVEPNRLASDEVFLRRVYLDIIGRIPTYHEAKSFLDSTDSDKRAKLIDRLLDSVLGYFRCGQKRFLNIGRKVRQI